MEKQLNTKKLKPKISTAVHRSTLCIRHYHLTIRGECWGISRTKKLFCLSNVLYRDTLVQTADKITHFG